MNTTLALPSIKTLRLVHACWSKLTLHVTTDVQLANLWVSQLLITRINTSQLRNTEATQTDLWLCVDRVKTLSVGGVPYLDAFVVGAPSCCQHARLPGTPRHSLMRKRRNREWLGPKVLYYKIPQTITPPQFQWHPLTVSVVSLVLTFTAAWCPLRIWCGSWGLLAFQMQTRLSLAPLARYFPSVDHFIPHTSRWWYSDFATQCSGLRTSW